MYAGKSEVVGGLRSLLRDAYKSGTSVRVAIDIDHTLAVIAPLMLAAFNRDHGTSFTADDHADYEFRSIGSNYEEMMPYYTEVWKSQYKQIPFSGNVGQIKELTKYYEVNILTARSQNNEGPTGGTVDAMHDWLRINGLGDIHVEICDRMKSKVADFDYHVYIDDSPVLAKEIESTEGRFMFLVSHRYNEHIANGPRVLHVAKSEVATNALLDIARKEIAAARKSDNLDKLQHASKPLSLR
ncbi:hypothetical protein M1590_04335 [Candidatus Marsarchaeota archaeon]|nr:hypothetical protein [Candidatus Marsarchaeota archaeon]